MKRVTLYAEGSGLSSHAGGWAFVIRCGSAVKEGAGGNPETTGCRMELEAVVQGLRALNQPCTVLLVAHSTYLLNGMACLPRWKANGWTRSSRSGTPLKHADLWQELGELSETHTITCQRLKGRCDHKDNDRCDELAAAQAALYTDVNNR
jgi:ribonuclease HI